MEGGRNSGPCLYPIMIYQVHMYWCHLHINTTSHIRLVYKMVWGMILQYCTTTTTARQWQWQQWWLPAQLLVLQAVVAQLQHHTTSKYYDQAAMAGGEASNGRLRHFSIQQAVVVRAVKICYQYINISSSSSNFTRKNVKNRYISPSIQLKAKSYSTLFRNHGGC